MLLQSGALLVNAAKRYWIVDMLNAAIYGLSTFLSSRKIAENPSDRT